MTGQPDKPRSEWNYRYVGTVAILTAITVVTRLLGLHTVFLALLLPIMLVLGFIPIFGVMTIFVLSDDPAVLGAAIGGLLAAAQFAMMLKPALTYSRGKRPLLLWLQAGIVVAHVLLVVVWLLFFPHVFRGPVL